MRRSEKLYFVGVKGIVMDNTEVLLVQADTKNHRIPTPPYWDLPGGRIQHGSNELDTLQREVSEETGVDIVGDPKYFDTVMSHHEILLETGEIAGLVLRVYRIELSKRAIVLSSEHHSFGWYAPKEAAKLLANKYPEDFCNKVAELI